MNDSLSTHGARTYSLTEGSHREGKGREGKGRTGLSFSSMTSGRGLPTTAAGTARVASASVMDGPDGSER